MARRGGRLGKSTYQNLKTDAERTAFLNYIKGDSQVNRLAEHKTPKADLKTYRVGIVPFGQGGALTALSAADNVPVSITGLGLKVHALMSTTFRSIISLQETEASIGGSPIIDFEPARVIVRLSLKSDVDGEATRTSGVTGRRYKKVKSRAPGIPFGRSLNSNIQQTGEPEGTAPTGVQSDYNEVMTALAANAELTAADGAWVLSGVSFVPEYFPNPSQSAVSYPPSSLGDLS